MPRGFLAACARILPLTVAAAAAVGGCRDIGVDPFKPVASGGISGAGGAGGTPPDGGGAGAGAGGGGGGTPLLCPNALVGFATEMGSTTGAGNAIPVVVTTLDALMAAADQDGPAEIRISGLIAVPAAMQTSTGFQVAVKSNKTIIGLGTASGLTGGGLLVQPGAENVIIKNLVIKLAAHTDAITIQQAKHVWVDHCDLSSDRDHGSGYYDGLIDITHGSDFVTVSWTHFYKHYNTSLVGHSDDNGPEDIGHLTVTYHHNLFEDTNSGTPRVRFGRVHVFNNHYLGVEDYAIASQMGAEVVVEKNVFEGVTVPITNQHLVSATSYPGLVAGENDNVYDAASAGKNIIGPADAGTFDFVPMYTVTETAELAAFLIGECVGPRP